MLNQDSPDRWSDDRLDAEASAYVYGECDFSDLPMTEARVLPTPEGHPDLDDDARLGWRTV